MRNKFRSKCRDVSTQIDSSLNILFLDKIYWSRENFNFRISKGYFKISMVI